MFRILNSKRVRLLDLVLVLLSIAFFGSLSGSTVFAQSGTTITTLGLPTNQIIIQFKRDAASARTEIGSQAQMDRLSKVDPFVKTQK